jgi:hypothetical protein
MLSGANGRIEKAGSRFIRILLSRQYTTTLTKIRDHDQREEQGRIERNTRSGQWSAVLLAKQQSNVQYLQRHVATQGRQRRRIRQTRRDSMEQVDTVSVDDGEMTGDDV